MARAGATLGARTQTRTLVGAARGVIASVVVFVVTIAVSMASYPGGNQLDRGAHGHDLWRNFLCDLIAPVSIGGAPNPVAATLAPIGMFALVVGLAAVWMVLLPHAFPGERTLGAVVRVAGALSTLGLVAVPLTPSSDHPVLHTVAVLLASLPALVAGAGGALGLARAGARGLAWLGAVLVAVTTIDVGLFARSVALGGAVPLALPALERVANTLLLVWMLAIARRVERAIA